MDNDEMNPRLASDQATATKQRRAPWAEVALCTSLSAILAVLLLLSISGAGPAAAPKVVEAKEFVVRDSDGRARAFLGMDAGEKEVFLDLSDKQGKTHISLVVDQKGAPKVFLTGSDERAQIFGTVAEGDAPLMIFSGKKNLRLHMGVNDDGFPFMTSGDDNKTIRFSMHNFGNSVRVDLFGEHNQPRLSLVVEEDGTPRVVRFGKDGKALPGG